MKIKNDLISIKTGKKIYDFNNLILNDYLYRFVVRQTSTQYLNKARMQLKMKYCLIKFDTPLENITEHSELHNTDFDICLMTTPSHTQSLDEKQVTITYQYNNIDYIYDYARGTAINIDLSQYYGRKITAIGFNSWWTWNTNYPVCAVLDTSNYNIYVQESQELAITRRDIISTDADFVSNSSLITGPAHLAPYGTPQIINQPKIYDNDHSGWSEFYDNGYGILYSIGLSQNKPTGNTRLENELIIGQDVSIRTENVTRRNIQLGDDLSGKKLVFNFPAGVYLGEEGIIDIITGSTGHSISTNTEFDTHWMEEILVKENGTNTIVYKYDTTEHEVINNYTEITLSDNFGVVTSINTNLPVIQYIQIEEPTTSDTLIVGPINNTEIVMEALYPRNNLYPGSELYPKAANYKYIVLKYKIWQNVHSGTYDNVVTTTTDTGLYYYEILPINRFGDLNLKIKYERG